MSLLHVIMSVLKQPFESRLEKSSFTVICMQFLAVN